MEQLLVESPIGQLLVGGDAAAVTDLSLPGRFESQTGSPATAGGAVSEMARQLAEYFGGRRQEFDVPLRPEGTDFQQTVWRALLAIPYGETLSYGELAARVGKPTAARAVGAANGSNPIAIVIPCHRVIGANGRLTGYGGGLDAKQSLLELEARTLGRTVGGPSSQLRLPG